MKKKYDRPRMLYAYEFPDRSVYVGLTYNERKRKIGHKFAGTVKKYIDFTNLEPVYVPLTGYMDENIAAIAEYDYCEKYRSEGWNILNRIKPGGLGGSYFKWSFESVKEEALKYNLRSDFSKLSNGAYEFARKHNHLEDICDHMDRIYHDKWTFEEILEITLTCKTRNEFCENHHGAYYAARMNKWLDELCKHMDKVYHMWTEDEIINEGLKYNTNGIFKKSNTPAYNAAFRKKLLPTLNNLRNKVA